jgi:hypothetical protein
VATLRTLRVDFLEDNETTAIDIDNWTFSATSYDSAGDVLDELTVTKYDGYVVVTAPPDLTTFWGNGYRSVVANLPFDIQVVTDDNVVWTPIIGTISVYSDITPGGTMIIKITSPAVTPAKVIKVDDKTFIIKTGE